MTQLWLALTVARPNCGSTLRVETSVTILLALAAHQVALPLYPQPLYPQPPQ